MAPVSIAHSASLAEYEAGTLGHLIDSNRTLNTVKGIAGFAMDRIRKGSYKKPAGGGIYNQNTGKSFTKAELEALPDEALLHLPAYVVRIMSHKRMLTVKRSMLEKANRVRASVSDKMTAANTAYKSYTDVAEARNHQVANESLGQLKNMVASHVIHGHELSPDEYQDLIKKVVKHANTLRESDEPADVALGNEIDSARKAFSDCVETHAQATKLTDEAELMRQAARASRHSSYSWIARMVPGEAQKTGMQIINQFGMLTMIASTPLLLISFKQMYDEFAGHSGGQPTQQ